jgi:hypothetical protein
MVKHLSCMLDHAGFFYVNRILFATELRVREARSQSTAEFSDFGVVTSIYRDGTPRRIGIHRRTLEVGKMSRAPEISRNKILWFIMFNHL